MSPPPAEAKPALPPGSPPIGRPEGNAAAAKCAPAAAPLIPAAAEKLPTATLKLPKGFKVEVYASGIANARSLRVGDKGAVFVGTAPRAARTFRTSPIGARLSRQDVA